MVVSVCSFITAKVQAFFLKSSCKSTSFLQGAFSSPEQMRAVLRSAACVFQQSVPYPQSHDGGLN